MSDSDIAFLQTDWPLFFCIWFENVLAAYTGMPTFNVGIKLIESSIWIDSRGVARNLFFFGGGYKSFLGGIKVKTVE